MADEIRDLVPQAIVMPAVSPEEALGAWKKYQDLRNKIIAPEDKQQIAGKEFLKKSYWRKLTRFFNLSVEILKEWKEVENEVTTYFVTARATAPNGAFQDGDGACDTSEKGLPKTPHNARAIAVTRAKNRAISDLVGGGEVSAEEVLHDDNDKKDKNVYKSPKITQPQQARLFAIVNKYGYTKEQASKWLVDTYNLMSSSDITRDIYEQICDDFELGKPPKDES